MANEIDNAGNIIAYKWLHKSFSGNYFSQTKRTQWVDNKLVADEAPTASNKTGIYCSRHAKSQSCKSHDGDKHAVLVKLMLVGEVVEHEFGFRAEEAWILGEVAA